MKIHLDYLEGRVEELENENMKLEHEKKKFDQKIEACREKAKLINDERQREIDQLKTSKQKLVDKINNLEQ